MAHHNPITVLLFTLAMLSNPHKVCSQAFPEGSSAIATGIGALSLIGEISRTFDQYSGLEYSAIGPIYFKYEYAVQNNIGLGLNVAYTSNRWAYNVFEQNVNGTEITHAVEQIRHAYSILARMNFHFGSSESFDPFVGFGLGFRNAMWNTTTTAPFEIWSLDFPTLIRLGMEVTLSMRYYFTEHIGVYAEVGAAKSIFQGGLAARF